MSGTLSNIRVVDLSRVLAGPACTQILGDLGADIIKIERPGPNGGDDTRKWGPPYLNDEDDTPTTESAYYLSANRNKRSLAVDLTTTEGQEIIHALLEKADILIQNFKPGGLDKYGLGYADIQKRHPHIIYASISGFGHNGPLAAEPGYDLMAQAMGGMMGVTGEINGQPMKIGVALSDIMTGLYAAIGILAALNARHSTGKGQHVDVALLDCTLASLTNLAQYYLTSGKVAPRQGNAHSTIVPYQAFQSQDGWMVIAVGNDTQFARFAKGLNHPEWADDERFARNQARVQNRDALIPMIAAAMKTRPMNEWVELFREIDIPSGPVNTMDKVFAMDQVAAREMKIEMQHPLSPTPISLVGSPLKLSENAVEYRMPPPVCGQHTREILHSILSMDETTIENLTSKNIIG